MLWRSLEILILPVLIFGPLIVGIHCRRRWEQTKLDAQHVTYEVIFPGPDLTLEMASDFFSRLSGLYPPMKRASIHGRETVRLEVFADEAGIHHLLSFPERLEDTILDMIMSAVPGLGIEPAMPITRRWKYGAELRPQTPSPLLTDPRTGKPTVKDLDPRVISGLLTSLGRLQMGDAVMVQVIFTPTGYDGNFKASAKLVTTAPHDIRAHKLIAKVLSGYGHLQVYKLRNIHWLVLDKISRHEPPIEHWRLTLPPNELAILCGLPIGGPSVPGLSYGRGQRLMAEAATPTGPIVVATSNFTGSTRVIGFSQADKTKHVHVIGTQGSGKSALMENLFIQDVEQGGGGAFLDPHGDSFHNVLDRIPRARINDVVVLDLSLSDNPVGFNVLEGDPHKVTNQVMAVFDRLYDIYKLSTTPDILRNVTLTLAHNGLSLLDIPAALAPGEGGKRFRDELIKKVPDEAVKNFWNREYNLMKPERQADAIAPLLRRLRPFETWPSLRGALGQTKSGFNFDDVLACNKIVLVNLSKEVGEEETKLYASLLLAKLWESALRRARIPFEQRRPFGVYVDEFHNYVNLPMSFATVLDEARKYAVSFTLAHQRMAQLPPDLRDAVLANARNKMFLAMGANDASILAREIPALSATLLQNLGKFEGVFRLITGDATLRPATGVTLAPGKSCNTAHAVRIASQVQYGRPLAMVDADITQRQRVVWEPQPRAQKGLRVVEA